VDTAWRRIDVTTLAQASLGTTQRGRPHTPPIARGSGGRARRCLGTARARCQASSDMRHRRSCREVDATGMSGRCDGTGRPSGRAGSTAQPAVLTRQGATTAVGVLHRRTNHPRWTMPPPRSWPTLTRQPTSGTADGNGCTTAVRPVAADVGGQSTGRNHVRRPAPRAARGATRRRWQDALPDAAEAGIDRR
jgi:hypothetical protein